MGIMYQARRSPFEGERYDLDRLSTYEPANLGFFFTNSINNAKKFYNVVEIDTVDINKTDFPTIDAGGKNLRDFIQLIKKHKRSGKPGVVLYDVVDGFLHDEINIVFDSNVIDRLNTIHIK